MYACASLALLCAQYNDMSASMAFLRAALAAQEVSEGLKNNHGVVRDFMRELLCGVSCQMTAGCSRAFTM